MNAKQRRKAWRMLTKLKRDRTPVVAPPPFVGRPGPIITTIAAVFRSSGVAHLAHDKSKWPRPVAAHNIKPVPRCWRTGDLHAHP